MVKSIGTQHSIISYLFEINKRKRDSQEVAIVILSFQNILITLQFIFGNIFGIYSHFFIL